ncbi:uncharacterized protein LOC116350166 [Contarinia nasturtii]|uniref:uncharacterized protein LOC116350166 n=1 Tax=Contarinia nasturtii TaxID=265458 RepID=UPI0012D4124E|nr:uncharacterized protein LOC116350166 [Contarinia nasturtii]
MVQSSPANTDIDASLIATLRVLASDKFGKEVKVRAMADGGSHMCMISRRLQQLLDLEQRKLSVPMEGAGRCGIDSKTFVDLKISPADGGSSTGEWIRAGVMSVVSGKLPPTQFDISDWNHLDGLPLADETFNMPDDIDILLSVEFMARIQGNKIIRDHSNSNRPVVSYTTFGWIVYGALPSSQKFASLSHLAIADCQRIADNLERLWRVDAVKEKSLLTSEEARCEQIFSETIKRAEDGRYSVAMPIMDNPPKLGNSLRAAIARQLQNER